MKQTSWRVALLIIGAAAIVLLIGSDPVRDWVSTSGSTTADLVRRSFGVQRD